MRTILQLIQSATIDMSEHSLPMVHPSSFKAFLQPSPPLTIYLYYTATPSYESYKIKLRLLKS